MRHKRPRAMGDVELAGTLLREIGETLMYGETDGSRQRLQSLLQESWRRYHAREERCYCEECWEDLEDLDAPF